MLELTLCFVGNFRLKSNYTRGEILIFHSSYIKWDFYIALGKLDSNDDSGMGTFYISPLIGWVPNDSYAH